MTVPKPHAVSAPSSRYVRQPPKSEQAWLDLVETTRQSSVSLRKEPARNYRRTNYAASREAIARRLIKPEKVRQIPHCDEWILLAQKASPLVVDEPYVSVGRSCWRGPMAAARAARFVGVALGSCRKRIPNVSGFDLAAYTDAKDDVATTFPYDDIASKIALALSVGLLVGLEREWAQKDVGVRTFAITALLGALSDLVQPTLLFVTLGGVILLVVLLNVRSLIKSGSVEITTSVALLLTVILGALIGEGHYFTAIASAILTTLLLAWKVELARFAGGLSHGEMPSAVLLALITFVVYPLLPNRFIDPWALVNPRQAWLIVIVVAGVGFLNYLMLRLYGTRGSYYAAFFGGLISSKAAVAELSAVLAKNESGGSLGMAVFLITSGAMFLRNLITLVIFAPQSAKIALYPLGSMGLAAAGLLAWFSRSKQMAPMEQQLRLSSPLAFPRVAKFAALFVALICLGTLVERFFGAAAFLTMSAVGGLVSGASTTASAAALTLAGKVSAQTAATATVITSMTSAMANMPLIYSHTKDKGLFRRLAGVCILIVAVGLIALLLRQYERG